MVTQFPLDPMHLVFLGVTRKLIQTWSIGPLPTRQGSRIINALSNTLLTFNVYLPKEFARKCRSLVYLDRWQATEFRTFLMYTGVAALKGRLSNVIYIPVNI